jgi:hypothetical protein
MVTLPIVARLLHFVGLYTMILCLGHPPFHGFLSLATLRPHFQARIINAWNWNISIRALRVGLSFEIAASANNFSPCNLPTSS